MLELRESQDGDRVVTRCGIPAGSIVWRGWGEELGRRTRWSYQVDHDRHLELGGPAARIRHSCEPNCGVLIRREARILEIHSLRALAAGEELTVDYATFEWEIEYQAGACRCGRPSCRGRIVGFRGLPADRRAAYGRYIAPYLREIEWGIRPISVGRAVLGQPRSGDLAEVGVTV